ncbi:carboxypeptidase-like regulatory domain-containing protein [Flagellimonas sp.]|uniref:carboxypeptidase-like regulatory domain-containing protein n=1 Tax=Flagellimonas sp. TaxID=2058762 RepID=UPI003AB57AF7
MQKLHDFLGKMRFRLVFIALMASSLSAFAQSQYTLTGTVTESGSGLPLTGASVFVENTSFGTVTDFDGNYSFTATLEQGTYTLSLSSLGFTPQKITFTAGGNSTITNNASLSEDLTSLDEVVVTALGIEANKKSLSNSIQNIKSDQLLEGNQANMVNGLQGKVSGVNIVSSGGAPGTSSIILIRGGSSITGSNQPLFVVDGIPIDNSTNSSLDVASINRASDINPADVESISILKGPAAAALYGIQAASGAVIITTKKGKAGVSTISYSGSLSVDKILGTPDVQSALWAGNGNCDRIRH